MKKMIYFVAMSIVMMLFANFQSIAQTIEKSTTAQVLYSINNKAVQQATAFCLIENSKVALLNREEQKIALYSLTSNAVEKSIDMPCAAIDFDYADGKFFLLDFNQISVVDENGLFVKDLPYQKPEGKPFALEKFRVVNGKRIINTADEKSWEVTENGLVLLDENYWTFSNGFKARTEKLNFSDFNLSVIDLYGRKTDSRISITEYNLDGDLATVKVIAADENQIALDIETTTDIENDLPRRFLIYTNPCGQMLSKTEIPFVYASDMKNRFMPVSTGVAYFLSAPDRVNLYELTPQRSKIQLPENCPAVFLNTKQSIEEPVEESSNDNINYAPQAGNNSVTRTQVYVNAYKFRDLQWTSTSNNVANCVTVSGAVVKTPPWINNSLGSETGVPYKWGGYTDWSDFASLAQQGKYTGQIYCPLGSGTNGQCSSGTPYASYSDTYVIGVDCSGFVSRCWETSRYTTVSLPNISTNLGIATNTSNFSSLQVGDIINDYNSHVRLCIGDNPTGTGTFMESSAKDWKVSEGYYSPSELTNYICYRYNNINDARLRLAQAITISPANPVSGGTLTATYRVGNYGTESWTGRVQLWIIQSNGNEICIDNNSAITLSAGSTSQTYTFTSPNVQSPVGTSKLEVRVLNSSSGNYSRSYMVGAGSFANPKTFTISASGGTTNYFQITTSSNPSAGGTTSGSGTFAEGVTRTVTATANSGYSFSNWTENGTVKSSNASYSFTLTANRNLVANFTPLTSNGTCKTVPDYDYALSSPSTSWKTDNWDTDGKGGCRIYRVAVTSGTKYTFKTGCGNGASADFDTKLYLYNASGNLLTSDDDGCEGNGGDIIEDYEFNYSGYAYLKVAGATSNAYGNYTLAYKKTPTYTISATAGNGGSISPSGSISVNSGNNITFTFEPNDDYEINQVLIDGTANSTAKGNGYYTFANVTENHSIAVTFRTSTGIEYVDYTNQLSIYPNPVKDVLHINLLGFENLTGLNAQIFDISGRTVLERFIAHDENGTATINVSNLSSGIYFLKIGNKREKFVKE